MTSTHVRCRVCDRPVTVADQTVWPANRDYPSVVRMRYRCTTCHLYEDDSTDTRYLRAPLYCRFGFWVNEGYESDGSRGTIARAALAEARRLYADPEAERFLAAVDGYDDTGWLVFADWLGENDYCMQERAVRYAVGTGRSPLHVPPG